MCGIFASVTKLALEHDRLSKIADDLKHRGPDDYGFEVDNINGHHISLLHTRLSILDLSKLGHQPFHFGSLALIYNGEIYNFKEIRLILVDFGYEFNSNSDTEILIKAYHKWGLNCFNKFNGMFCGVLLDKSKNELIVFRDRAGVKPLYIYDDGGEIAFSSETRAFRRLSKFNAALSKSGLKEYLKFGYISGESSIYQSVKKCIPGTVQIYNLKSRTLNKPSVVKFWPQTEMSEQNENINYEEAVNHLDNLLISSCRYRAISDVPIGVFLSGGYDSSTIAAILQKNSSKSIKTFTIGFDESEFDESRFARNIANYIGADHYDHICSESEMLSIFSLLPDIYDEPISDSSIIPTVLLSKFTKEHVTVALSADGADELFGGYDKYQKIINIYKILNRTKVFHAPKPLLGVLSRALGLCFKNNPSALRKINKISDIASSSKITQLMDSSVGVFTENELSDLLIEDSSYIREYDDCLPNLQSLLNHDFNNYLCDDILVKVDRASMAYSLEAREPMLDYRVVEFSRSLPDDYKFRNGITKSILKDVAKKYFPNEILDRKKMGFGSPVSKWLEGPLSYYVNHYLSNDFIKNQGLFKISYIQDMIRKNSISKSEYSNKIWNLLIFQIWYERWIINAS